MNNKFIANKTFLWGACIGLFIFTFAGIFSRLNVDVYHQGIVYAAAVHLLEGTSLYDGGEFVYGPLMPFLNALGLFIFGKHLLVLQLMSAACYGGVSVLLWRVWSRFMPEWLSGVMVFGSFLLAPFLFWEFHPWSSVYALLFLLLALYYTIRWLETLDYRLLKYVGIFTALTFWSRQTVGLFLAAMLLFLVVLLPIYLRQEKNFRIKSLTSYILPLAAVSLFFFFILVRTHSLEIWFESCFSSRVDWALTISGNHLSIFLLAHKVFFELFDNFKPSLWMIIPLAMCLLFIELIINAFRDNKTEKSKQAILFTYLSICFVSLLQYYPVPDPRHHFWSVLPMFALPVIFLLQSLKQNASYIPVINKVLPTQYIFMGLSSLIMIFFLAKFYDEIKLRLITGVELDPTVKLLPAWKRLSTFNTQFTDPPVLQGMMGTATQVAALARLHDAITLYINDHPEQNFLCPSGWDRMCRFYLEKNNLHPKSKDPALLISEKPPRLSRPF